MGNLNKQTKRILGDELEEILNILDAQDKINERQAKINLYVLDELEEILNILDAQDKINERQAKINLYVLGAVICLILYNVVEIIQSFM